MDCDFLARGILSIRDIFYGEGYGLSPREGGMGCLHEKEVWVVPTGEGCRYKLAPMEGVWGREVPP